MGHVRCPDSLTQSNGSLAKAPNVHGCVIWLRKDLDEALNACHLCFYLCKFGGVVALVMRIVS